MESNPKVDKDAPRVDRSKPSKFAIEQAALCWFDSRTSNAVVDHILAGVFAEKIDEILGWHGIDCSDRDEFWMGSVVDMMIKKKAVDE